MLGMYLASELPEHEDTQVFQLCGLRAACCSGHSSIEGSYPVTVRTGWAWLWQDLLEVIMKLNAYLAPMPTSLGAGQ